MSRAIAACSGTGATHEPSPDGLGPTGGYPTIAFDAEAMLADDVAQIVQRLPYLEVAPARLFSPGLLSELRDASDRIALKVAKLTEASERVA